MKIVVKVGTQSILSEHGNPVNSVICSIAKQLAELHKAGHKVVLVSSGAVGLGRYIIQKAFGIQYGSSARDKQILASLGQPKLMHVYTQMFKKYNILASQILMTKQDFYTRRHYLNICRLITGILAHNNIIPIINENDSVAIEELMFTDNDELAGLIAAQIDADKLIVLSNVEGVYTGHPTDPRAKLIPLIDSLKKWPRVSSVKTASGRGGMISKLNVAKKVAKLGIMIHIASINQKDVIKKLVANKRVGTTIMPVKKQSSIKRWLACCPNQTEGKIVVNDVLATLLQEKKRVLSILPVGIKGCSGSFEKGSLIEIVSTNNQLIGLGLARYGFKQLKKLLGQKNKPVFIHYTYLQIL